MFRNVTEFVNYLAARHNAAGYLELAGQSSIIGTINCGRKALVSPCKELERPGAQSERYNFFNVPWPVFFETEPEATVPRLWDILHLSGPAPFAAALNTFTMGLERLDHHGVAIISHTVPSSQAALDARAASAAGIPWAGEAFKIVLAVHDTFDALSYCTVMNVAEPFTVLWRSQPRTAGQAFASLEAIGTLDFFDFLQQAHLLMPITGDLLLDVLGMTLEPSLYRDPQVFTQITGKVLSQTRSKERAAPGRPKGFRSRPLAAPLRAIDSFRKKLAKLFT